MANTTNCLRKVFQHREVVKFTVADPSFPKVYLTVALFEVAGSFCLFLRQCLPHSQIQYHGGLPGSLSSQNDAPWERWLI